MSLNATVQVFGTSLHTKVGAIVASQSDYEPVWFGTLTFYPSRGQRSDREHATASFHRYMIQIANKTKSHLLPIASIGRTKAGWYHIHFVLLMERGKERPSYRQMKKWWKHGNRNEWKLYQPDKAGIFYTLQHEHYIPVRRPYCPEQGNCCRQTCVKKGDKDWVRRAV